METLISSLIAILRTVFLTRTNLALENAALRQQLAIYQRLRSVSGSEQATAPSGSFSGGSGLDWTRPSSSSPPETVIAWHRQGFRLFWRRRSMPRKVGRPRIPRDHIAFIRRISSDHPEWGEDKIAEELAAKFGFTIPPARSAAT